MYPTYNTIKRCFAVLFCSLLINMSTKAQYYYNDITASNEYPQQSLFSKNRVAQVQLNSFESNGTPSTGFKGSIGINSNYNQITASSQSEDTKPSVSISYYNNGLLEKSKDSSADVVTQYDYRYGTDKKLYQINSISAAPDGKNTQKETHLWLYNNNGYPEKILRIRNDNDTTTVKFVLDEKNNVIEETAYRKNQQVDQVYYYYDDKNRLTDIVRYNNRLKKLVPDFSFEYNDAGQLTQKITVFRGTDYLLWRYDYNENGLRKRDLCYDKQKKLVGRIEYAYAFR